MAAVGRAAHKGVQGTATRLKQRRFRTRARRYVRPSDENPTIQKMMLMQDEATLKEMSDRSSDLLDHQAMRRPRPGVLQARKYLLAKGEMQLLLIIPDKLVTLVDILEASSNGKTSDPGPSRRPLSTRDG